MDDWMIWLIGAGVVVICEIFTGTFFLLMIAVGLVAGAVVAWMDASIPVQLLVAAIIGAVATYALRRSKIGSVQKVDVARDPNALLDIGQTIVVNDWVSNGSGKLTARVMYRGAMWDVELEPGAASDPGSFIIHEIRGSRLIVTKAA